MRSIFFFALTMTAAGFAGAGESRGFYELRGFVPGQCYEHPAVRRCEPSKCVLEVFPGASRGLVFALNAGKDSLLFGKATADYGLFRFRMLPLGPGQAPALKILGVRRVALRDWDAAQPELPQGKAVSCP